MRPKIYVAGPLSTGNREQNVRNAMVVGFELIDAGFAPLIPHLSHFMDQNDKLGHATWLEVDLPWVASADAVLRLPGESKGADMEVDLAKELDIPVYLSVADLLFSPPRRGHEGFHQLLRQIGALHDKKQRDYGTGADPFANVRGSLDWGIPPWLGAMLRANDKVKRIQKFAQTQELANESVEDSFMDLAVYALIALVLYREDSMSGSGVYRGGVADAVPTREAA